MATFDGHFKLNQKSLSFIIAVDSDCNRYRRGCHGIAALEEGRGEV